MNYSKPCMYLSLAYHSLFTPGTRSSLVIIVYSDDMILVGPNPALLQQIYFSFFAKSFQIEGLGHPQIFPQDKNFHFNQGNLFMLMQIHFVITIGYKLYAKPLPYLWSQISNLMILLIEIASQSLSQFSILIGSQFMANLRTLHLHAVYHFLRHLMTNSNM
ncbi:hypothetical protein CR513_29606, partial [Mucuna pruriens]